MLRIAQCTDSFLPIADGVGRVAFEYAHALARRGHESYVITPQCNQGFRGGYPFEIVDYRTPRLPVGSVLKYGVATLDIHYRARADAIPFDIVHAHSPGSAGLEAARLASRLHIPLIGTFHPRYFEDVSRFLSGGGLAEAAVRNVAEFYTRCDEVWCVSSHAADTLRQAGYLGRLELMTNGVVAREVSQADLEDVKEIYHLSEQPVLLYVGQLDFSRGLGRIIDAAGLLKFRNIPFQLLFVGQGPDDKAARKRIRERGLMGAARFLGVVSDEKQLSALYALSSLFVFPSHHITAGLVVHEAAAMGTPSIVTLGSAPAEDVVDGVNGIVCPDTAEALADAVGAALSDPRRLARLGAEAKITMGRSWDDVMDAVEKRYAKLTQRERFTLTRKMGLFRKELSVMDETLQMRAIALIGRFLKQDLDHVYAYPHKILKVKRLPARKSIPLPRATPESQGIPSSALTRLYQRAHEDKAAQITGMVVVRRGKLVAEAAWAPYERALPRQLYSMSKSITATAVGMCVDEGRLDLDERLTDLFPDKAPDSLTHPARKMTVRHLLTMSTGSEFNEIGTALGADWVWEFLHAGVKFEPGTQFEYNSLNTYMLSAIVREKTGVTLTEYLHPRLYEPLGIVNAEWELCPLGIEKGGWGLSLTAEDAAKIGQLYLNKGLWTVDGKQRRLLSEDWVREATRPQIDTPNGELPYGYGYQIWMCPHEGGFMFNGAFGQYMAALPDADTVVTLFSGTAALFAQGRIMDYLEEALTAFSAAPLPEDPQALSQLKALTGSLSCIRREPFFRPELTEDSFPALTELLDGRVYGFSRNVAGLFPTVLSSVHNNYTTGVEHAAFKRSGEGTLIVTFDEGRSRHSIEAAAGCYATATVSQRGETHLVRTSVQCQRSDAGEWLLYLAVHFIETPFTRLLTFRFKGDEVTLLCDESPAVKDSSAMLLDLTGITRVQAVRTLLPMLEQEKMQSRLRTFTTNSAQGRL